jgi:hypothetical protein
MKSTLAILLATACAALGQTTATHVENYNSATIKGKPAKVSSRNAGWRWTHDGATLTTAPAKCYGETWTPWHIVESPTVEDACKAIERRGLKVPDRLAKEIESTREMLAEEAKRAEAEK